MKQIITVIKDGKKSIRIGNDAINCLRQIEQNRQIPQFTTFAKNVARKLHASMIRPEIME